jgi:aspartate-semialdehyde dehydrogenase
MRVAVFGATGQAGTAMRQVLAERSFPVDEVRFFASARSAGRTLPWADDLVEVEEASPRADYRGIDIALLAMGGAASRAVAPVLTEAGAIVIDNSSAWRMDPRVPLVVPEVNRSALDAVPLGIVANPNCTTAVAMPPLEALRVAAGLRRVTSSSYQAVSGAGRDGVDELTEQVVKLGERAPKLVFGTEAMDLPSGHRFVEPIAYNVVPVAGALVDRETEEEHKFRNESRKILGLPDLPVSCTCVRVPVYTGHCHSLNVELERHLDLDEAARVLSQAPGVQLVDVPTPQRAAGTDASLVGRLRVDPTVEHGLALFVAGDNLRKGAALNAVQIAEELLPRFG